MALRSFFASVPFCVIAVIPAQAQPGSGQPPAGMPIDQHELEDRGLITALPPNDSPSGSRIIRRVVVPQPKPKPPEPASDAAPQKPDAASPPQ